MRIAAFTAALLGLAAAAQAHGPAGNHAKGLPKDPYFSSSGSWGQDHPDQWAIRRAGFDDKPDSAWSAITPEAGHTVVAVIDTGLDWNHADIDWNSLWKNPGEIPNNGIDDDGNGFVDDIMGWNFVDGNNKPWDHDGHGTFVTGVIGATWNNGLGLAGIDPNARLMVLKALNTFGNTRASLVAQAITYAADNGAKVINLSVGGEGRTEVEKLAMDYARAKGVLVVVAAGNEGRALSEWSYADAENAIIVAATDTADKHAIFSNSGPEVDISAPGIDVLSLRARYTDTLRGIPEVEYKDGNAYVGADKRYYRASGTSFAAPIVAGTASLIFSTRPGVSSEDVRRMLLQSARDIGTPGLDQHTGYGLLDAKRALRAASDFFVEARIDGVEVVQAASGPVVRVQGQANASDFARAELQLGAGKQPEKWTTLATNISATEFGAIIADVPATAFAGGTNWILRLITTHANGGTREARYALDIE